MTTHRHRITGEKVTVTDQYDGITVFTSAQEEGEELLTYAFNDEYEPLPAPSAQLEKLQILRRYVSLVNEVYEERQPGEWGDIDTDGRNDHVDDPREVDIVARPFVFVETSHYGQTWITLWSDPDEAVDYHANQEYAEDWRFDRLVDLRDLSEYSLAAKAVKS
jgi:hypothetical protein